jgi:hypothetical protein
MFESSRTGAKASELRAYKTEGEMDAKRRLEAAGWKFGGVDYEFVDAVFSIVDKGTITPGSQAEEAP